MVEETWLVQKDEASHGGDGNKLMTWQWLSSYGRIVESSVALVEVGAGGSCSRWQCVEECCFVKQLVLHGQL